MPPMPPVTQALLLANVAIYCLGLFLGPWFDGKYYVSEVCHRFDGASGIRTEFTGERPGIGGAS